MYQDAASVNSELGTMTGNKYSGQGDAQYVEGNRCDAQTVEDDQLNGDGILQSPTRPPVPTLNKSNEDSSRKLVANVRIKRATGKKKRTSKTEVQLHTRKGRSAANGHVSSHRDRYKSGRAALREICRYQAGSQLLIPRKPFSRLVREFMASESRHLRIRRSAVEAVQEATEQFLTTVFSSTQLMAIHAKRIAIQPEDMKLLFEILKDWGQPEFHDAMLTRLCQWA